jgi:ketosteroid isomerase-like protein
MPDRIAAYWRAMSQENVEIVRAAVDAANGGDWDAVFKDAAPSFEVDLSRAVGPLHGVYGLDQWRSAVEDFAGSWESLRFETGELIDAGEHVVVPWTMHARGRDGIEVPSRVTWVWSIRNGAIVRACMYQERQEALEAAGLSE